MHTQPVLVDGSAQQTPGHKRVVIFTGPQLVWLREKAAEWGLSEGAALRRLVDAYRRVEQQGIEDGDE